MNKYTVLFQGDSITDCGRIRNDKPLECKVYGTGYANLIAARLMCDNHEAVFANTAVSGNRIADTYARWIEDTLNIDYDILSMLSGINDVGFQLRMNRGSAPDRFRFIYDRMLKESKNAHPDALIVIGQPFIFKVKQYDQEGRKYGDIFEDWDDWNGRIIELGEIARDLCKKYDGVYVPYREKFEEEQKNTEPSFWSKDGIHPNVVGHELMARLWIERVSQKFNLI